MDAMNHAATAPGSPLLDLSRADFEQAASDADIDNPFVPNTDRVRGGTGNLGRGQPPTFRTATVLLLPFAANRLEPRLVPGFSGTGSFQTYWAPRALVLDVAAIDIPAASSALVGGACLPFLSPVFDRDPSLLGDSRVTQALSRKSLGRTANGNEILQRTRTSSRDFEYHAPMLRSLNRPP